MKKLQNRRKRKLLINSLKIFGVLLGGSILYLILCIWMMPPITITQIGDAIRYQGIERRYVSWEEMSPDIKLAAMASEDQRYLEHGGFDWISMEKSMHQKPRKGKKRRPAGAGASTISQQVAKNVFLWQGNGVWRYIRKIPEFIYTQLIEWVWGKKRIMEVYLNVIEMGPGVYGVEAASRKYFHKSAAKLTAQEAAMIIACLPNPKKFTVVPLSRRVAWRAPQIVRQMGFLSGDEDIYDFIH